MYRLTSRAKPSTPFQTVVLVSNTLIWRIKEEQNKHIEQIELYKEIRQDWKNQDNDNASCMWK